MGGGCEIPFLLCMNLGHLPQEKTRDTRLDRELQDSGPLSSGSFHSPERQKLTNEFSEGPPIWMQLFCLQLAVSCSQWSFFTYSSVWEFLSWVC